MLLTILLLIFTVVVVPFVCLNFGYTPNELQYEILQQMSYTVGIVIAYCFIVGELSRNNSQVDKLWSIVPILYTWQMTLLAPELSEKMVFMSILVTIWGARLTFILPAEVPTPYNSGLVKKIIVGKNCAKDQASTINLFGVYSIYSSFQPIKMCSFICLQRLF